MSAQFVSASSQRLLNATHTVTAFPYSVGLWAYPVTTTAGTIFSLVDTGATNQYQRVSISGGSQWSIRAAAGGAENSAASGTVTANRWAFLVARFIDATNRRLDVLQFSGSVVSIQGTLSRAFPTSAETMALGANEISAPADFLNGSIAEFWYTKTDIQPDAAALNSNLLRQLAYGGPFSVPHVAQAIVEYRALRSHPTLNDPIETYSSGAENTWTNTGSATLGPHPPLPYWYVKPNQTQTLLTI
jgi:hypothetical protein